MHKEGATAMDVDEPQAANGHSSVLKENGLLLLPVLPQEAGEGLPYAPANWPNPGDTWGWRVGKRTAISGYYLDRYLYVPHSLNKSRRGRDGFASKLSVMQYIQGRFPGADIESFFASFSWKIPSKQAFLVKEHHTSSCMLSEDISEPSLSDCQNGGPACKAGNRRCPSLTEEDKAAPVGTTMFCDICCSEPNFCRDCCCILCCKTIDSAFGGYTFIRCQAKVNDGLICGHAAHLICALRSYMAGTVGGTIGLDAEYYCRRCDSKTELVEHSAKIFKLCESVESLDDSKKMLELVLCLLRGSLKKDVKRLLNRAQLVLQKLEGGNDHSNIWTLEDDIPAVKIGMADLAKMRDAEKVAEKAAKEAVGGSVQTTLTLGVALALGPATAPHHPLREETLCGGLLAQFADEVLEVVEEPVGERSRKRKKDQGKELVETVMTGQTFSQPGLDMAVLERCHLPSDFVSAKQEYIRGLSPEVLYEEANRTVLWQKGFWETIEKPFRGLARSLRAETARREKAEEQLKAFVENVEKIPLVKKLKEEIGTLSLRCDTLTAEYEAANKKAQAYERENSELLTRLSTVCDGYESRNALLKVANENLEKRVADLNKKLKDASMKAYMKAPSSREVVTAWFATAEGKEFILGWLSNPAGEDVLYSRLEDAFTEGMKVGISQAYRRWKDLHPDIKMFEAGDGDDDWVVEPVEPS